jgi:sugar phosphate isomerase/epimerase
MRGLHGYDTPARMASATLRGNQRRALDLPRAFPANARMKFLPFPALALAALLTGTVLAEPIPDDCKTNGYAIGCQAYTFNRFTVFEAIEKTAEAGGKVIEFFPGQKLSKEEPTVKWGHEAADDVVEKVKAKLAQHKIKAVNYGVVSIPVEEEGARKIFAFAKKMGMYGVTTESFEAIDTIEKMVKEFDIKVGFHDHPRKQDKPNYRMWDPYFILELTKGRDERIGACADTGHWQTSGINPVWAVRTLKGRIISSHMKDKLDYGPSHDVPYGTGVGEVGRVLDELKAQGFNGNISIEYEYNWENSLPEVKQCVDFVRAYQPKK